MMEMVGWDANTIHATPHSGGFDHRLVTRRDAQMRVANDRPGGKATWPFTRAYQLILGLAAGGERGGQKGIDDAAFL